MLAPHSKPRLKEAVPDFMAARMALYCLRYIQGLGIWGQKSLPRGLLW